MTAAVDVFADDDVPVTVRPSVKGGGQLSGIRMAEFGAMAAAAGYEADEVGGFISDVTLAAHSTVMSMLPGMLAKLTSIQKARIQRIMQAVRALPDYSLVIQPGPWQRLTGVAQQPPTRLVSMEAVLQILATAAEEPPRP